MALGDQAADRIYYDDATTTEFTAHVSAIREVARVNGSQVWQIALDRTAFYPTSGGQPHDTGTLIATSRSGALLEVAVTAVEEDASGEVWHTTAKPLQEGTAVRGTIDRARRNDHMQQHSAQHLLSAILLRDCAARTTSFHLGEATSTIDLDVALLSEEQLAAVETTTNSVVASALPLSVRYASPGEATAMLAEGILRKLPARQGPIRLIIIPGLDTNACGGTHVATTAEIGPVLLRGTEKVRGGLRLSFVSGDRARATASRDFKLLNRLAACFSTAADEIPERHAAQVAELKACAKERHALLLSLAEAEARRLAAGVNGVIVHALDASKPGRDAAYAKLLASQVIALVAACRIAVVSFTENDQTTVVLAARPGEVNCGAVLRESFAGFDGRGGGSKDLAVGALPAQHFEGWLTSLLQILP